MNKQPNTCPRTSLKYSDSVQLQTCMITSQGTTVCNYDNTNQRYGENIALSGSKPYKLDGNKGKK
jgi:hypothetical protein